LVVFIVQLDYKKINEAENKKMTYDEKIEKLEKLYFSDADGNKIENLLSNFADFDLDCLHFSDFKTIKIDYKQILKKAKDLHLLDLIEIDKNTISLKIQD
jgi:hypothetical protein